MLPQPGPQATTEWKEEALSSIPRTLSNAPALSPPETCCPLGLDGGDAAPVAWGQGAEGQGTCGGGRGGGRPGSPRHLEPPATEGHSELGGAVESRVNHSVQGPGVSSRRRRGRGVDSRGRPPRLPATTGGGGESAGRAPGSRRRGRPRGPLIARPAPASPDAAPRAPSRSFPTGAFSPTFPAFGAQRIRPTSPPAPGHGVSHRTPADLPRGRRLQDTPPRLGPGPGGRSLR